MPIHYLRTLTSPGRTQESNRRLGRSLAFVAGAVNAGGFLAVGQNTSHMTGIVSALADNVALGEIALVIAGLSSILAFLTGAATSAIRITWGRRRALQSEYAVPLMVEAVLLLCFGFLGSNLERHRLLFVPATVGLLCFVMGLQNAMITKISKAEIRTTHVTGLVTDIGIELGKLSCTGTGATLCRARGVSLPTARGFACLAPCWRCSWVAASRVRSGSST
jgi:uncharacterized membrane protein YoaK (UPF0700 family)